MPSDLQRGQAGHPAGVLSEPVRRFLSDPRLAALATVGRDGSPHQTLVWYRLEPDDTITVNALVGRRWPAELQRVGRAALAVSDANDPLSWVGLTSELISSDDDPERARADIIAIARRYDGPPSKAYLDDVRRQARITFRLRICRVHDHLRASDG